MDVKETQNEIIIQGEVECSSCQGTGLYKGIAERDGAAVICRHCKGTGKATINLTYQKFKGRKLKKGVKRVYDSSHGYCITHKDVYREDGTVIHFSKAGVRYPDWLKGKQPIPIKELYCPYTYTHQGLQSKDVNGLYATRCNTVLLAGDYIPKCPLASDKAKCWKIFEGAK